MVSREHDDVIPEPLAGSGPWTGGCGGCSWASAFSALGTGLTLPFLYVYLAEVRDFETATVGWLFAWMGLVGFVAAPVGGTLIDRFGPRPVMLAGLVVEALAVADLGQVDRRRRRSWSRP